MPGAARAHFLDREKRVEVGLRLLRRAVELTEERVRTASAPLICQDDIAPGPSSVGRQHRVAEKLGRRLTGTSGEIHESILATRLAIESGRRQYDDAEGDGAAAARGLILVNREAVAAGLGHGNTRTGLITQHTSWAQHTSRSGATLGARPSARRADAGRREHSGGERHTGCTPRHRLCPCLRPRLLFRLVGRDVLSRKLLEVRRVDEPDFPAFFERRIRREAIAQRPSDRPERADTNRRRAVNEHRSVRRVVGDLEERICFGIGRIRVDDRNVEVTSSRPLPPRTARRRRDARTAAAG